MQQELESPLKCSANKYLLKGTIKDKAGNPIQNLTLTTTSSSGIALSKKSINTDSEGNYSLIICEGENTITVVDSQGNFYGTAKFILDENGNVVIQISPANENETFSISVDSVVLLESPGKPELVGLDLAAKRITSFLLNSPIRLATISDYTITLYVSTSRDITSLSPIFTYDGKMVSVNGIEQISGYTKQNFSNQIIYDVTARNGTKVSYTVNVVKVTPLSSLTYSENPARYGVDVSITNNVPTVTGTVSSYSVSPALPAGLSINSSNGIISGTPTILQASSNYTITAVNPIDSISYNLSIEIKEPSASDMVGTSAGQVLFYDVVNDLSGNAYVVGTTFGSINGQIINGSGDALLSKYDNNGKHIWTRLIGVFGKSTQGNSLSICNSGNIYISGSSTGGLSGQALNGIEDVFIAKYDSNGNLIWLRQRGGSGVTIQPSESTICDSSENIYITSRTNGAFDSQTFNGSTDAFIIKYDLNGNWQWTRLLAETTAKSTFGKDLEIDASGNIYLIGVTQAVLASGTAPANTKANITNRDLFIAKYQSDGTFNWARQTEGPVIGTDIMTMQVQIDKLNNKLYLGGYASGTFNGQSLTGLNDAFVSEYDANGNHVWTKLYGLGSKSVFTYNLKLYNSKLYLIGSTDAPLNGSTVTGTLDGFIMTLSNTGILETVKLFGYPGGSNSFLSLSFYPPNQMFIVGYTNTIFDGISPLGTNNNGLFFKYIPR
ncbi:MAG: putative Ig domain-containing protein [Leptospiraceae bacterium]|nr:putative Ig domain-containing protein [Leptospiraceae bacterium]